jgi:hypothetical protein
MKMTILSTVLFAALTLTACNEVAPAAANNANEAKATTEQVTQSDAISPLYKDGTNDQNRGDKLGLVRVHGTMMSSTSGDVILYESEGRNASEVARTRLLNRAFDFGELELGRGFYKIGYNGETNATDIIINPDEPDLFVEFKSSRLSATKSAEGSAENTAWFDYQKSKRSMIKKCANFAKA